MKDIFNIQNQSQYIQGKLITVTHAITIPDYPYPAKTSIVSSFNDYYDALFNTTPNSVTVELPYPVYSDYLGVFYIAVQDMTLVDGYVVLENTSGSFSFTIRKFDMGVVASNATGSAIIEDTTLLAADVNTVVSLQPATQIGNLSGFPSRVVEKGQRLGVFDLGAAVGDLQGTFVITLLFQQT